MKNLSFLKLSIIILLMAVAFSCVAQRPKFTIYQTQHWNFPFGNNFEKALYKATIDVKDNHMSGLLLAKRLSDTTIRIVFSNEVGIGFFDIEFNREEAIVHYMFPSMDKKIFVSILEDDLRNIFVEDFTIDSFKREDNSETVVYTTQSARGTLIYTVEKETYNIRNISTGVKKVKKGMLNFTYDKNPLPVAISVSNPFIGLNIQLNLLKTE